MRVSLAWVGLCLATDGAALLLIGVHLAKRLVLRGIVALASGVLALALPGITLHVLVLWFGVYALADGAVNLAGAFRAAEAHERWRAFVMEGVIGIVAGFLTFVWPAMTALALVYFIAACSVAIRLRRWGNILTPPLSRVAEFCGLRRERTRRVHSFRRAARCGPTGEDKLNSRTVRLTPRDHKTAGFSGKGTLPGRVTLWFCGEFQGQEHCCEMPRRRN